MQDLTKAIQRFSLNPQHYGNLGGIFAAYTHTIRPHAHREPLKAKLLSKDGYIIHHTDALLVLKWIGQRNDDGVTYTCTTDLSGEIPKEVIIQASCTEWFWRFGVERRPKDEHYDISKGYFDYTYREIHDGMRKWRYVMNTITDHKTGEILKDEHGRNLAVLGFCRWDVLLENAIELFNKGVAFDFCSDGVPHHKIAHALEGGADLVQDAKTGKWKKKGGCAWA